MLLLTLVTVALALFAVFRGVDVRLALLSAALVLAGVAGDPMAVVRTFLETFSNSKFVVPICTAMGFAYVLRHTGCDQHLVRLLVRPLRRARALLIPGVVGVGFLVNIPVISQTSTAVCIGPVVVPLMRAGGLSPATAGASLLLGASIGGELLNPGAPELRTVATEVSRSVPGRGPVTSGDVIAEVIPLVFPHLLFATLIFWWLSVRAERRAAPAAEEYPPPPEDFRVNVARALVPGVPIALLFVTGPPLNLLPSEAQEWLRANLVGKGESPDVYGGRLIGLAMLVGVATATLVTPQAGLTTVRAFFEGAGYAFTHIVSIIVTAVCFAEALGQVGVAERMHGLIEALPSLLLPCAGAFPWAFGFLSGSGMASTQGLYAFFVPPALATGADPVEVGALVSVASAAGRTMSPVAAVVLMSASLTGTHPFTLVRRVGPPLVTSLALVIALRIAGVL
ncbi:MAG TPA: C4-dicarboxylate transporter DcuC [Gemmataceae bacterium]